MFKKKVAKLSIIIITSFLLATLIAYPSQMLSASVKGVNLWFQIVLPSLFPFMVGVGILNHLGAANILGAFLEPIVKPIFKVSGYGAFPFFMGIMSGYPMGAKITNDLLQQKRISNIEAQRILSFSNNPGILFILGTVATGMYSKPSIGYFIILVTVLSAISTGFLFRFYGKSIQNVKIKNTPQLHNNQKLGEILGESIRSAMDTLIQIGGFIILFSVIIQSLMVTGAMKNLSIFIYHISPISISQDSIYGILSGFLEMTNGSNILSQINIPLQHKIAFTCGVLSWGGLSILAQTLSILRNSEIKLTVYLISKCTNSLFAFIYAYLLYPFFNTAIEKAAPVFKTVQATAFNRLYCSLFLLSVLFILLIITKNGCSKKH